jgi:hypothetical protein
MNLSTTVTITSVIVQIIRTNELSVKGRNAIASEYLGEIAHGSAVEFFYQDYDGRMGAAGNALNRLLTSPDKCMLGLSSGHRSSGESGLPRH